jgi:hypothetical protein
VVKIFPGTIGPGNVWMAKQTEVGLPRTRNRLGVSWTLKGAYGQKVEAREVAQNWRSYRGVKKHARVFGKSGAWGVYVRSR